MEVIINTYIGKGENKMKKLGIISMLLILILSGCIGDKYSATALKLEEQQIKIDITDIAHENAEEIMKQKGYDDLLVMIKGSCWGDRAFGIVLDEQQATDHYIYEVEGKYIAIPKGTEDFVKELEIDYEKTNLYEALVVNTKYK